MVNVERKEILRTEKAPAAVGPYSVGVKVGNLIFLSGQLGLDPKTDDFVEGGIEQQTGQSLENLKSILEVHGLGLENIVKTTVFLKDMNQFRAMNAVYAQYFNDNPPARSTVEVAALPKNGLIEIEAIAVVFE